jgi:drug/metabolite transporter (DMT)-like permease
MSVSQESPNINSNQNEINEEDDNVTENRSLIQDPPNEPRLNLLQGIFYAFLSALFFSLSALIVKYLPGISPSELAIFRFSGMVVLSIPEICFNRHNPFGSRDVRYFLLIRGVTSGFSLSLRFYCVHYLPIAEASVIIFSFPIIVTIFAKIFLKVSYNLIENYKSFATFYLYAYLEKKSHFNFTYFFQSIQNLLIA